MAKIIKCCSNYAGGWALRTSSTGFCWALRTNSICFCWALLPNKKKCYLFFEQNKQNKQTKTHATSSKSLTKTCVSSS